MNINVSWRWRYKFFECWKLFIFSRLSDIIFSTFFSSISELSVVEILWIFWHDVNLQLIQLLNLSQFFVKQKHNKNGTHHDDKFSCPFLMFFVVFLENIQICNFYVVKFRDSLLTREWINEWMWMKKRLRHHDTQKCVFGWTRSRRKKGRINLMRMETNWPNTHTELLEF